MTKRSMYIWKLSPVIDAEGTVTKVVEKARRANLSALWVKIAQGAAAYSNTTGSLGDKFKELVDRCHAKNIEVWGWHVPRCANVAVAKTEAEKVKDIAATFSLDGLIMDAEHGAGFFLGDAEEAEAYGKAMRDAAHALRVPLAISSHDIPQNMSGWLPKFNKIANHADLNFPQVYYGSSPSVEHRLSRAEDANSHVTMPFRPVGAGWVGDGGGCTSASACAERAREFMRLVKDRNYDEYSFWHWQGAPSALWAVLNTTPA
ncbi:hypothetical protein ACC713_20300 [Rhizobium johnstonii]|uniref:hypothetical protein n=1 Tax=Rhizobium johnstonii TaxID=3019933 RepID=UPI003F951A38